MNSSSGLCIYRYSEQPLLGGLNSKKENNHDHVVGDLFWTNVNHRLADICFDSSQSKWKSFEAYISVYKSVSKVVM